MWILGQIPTPAPGSVESLLWAVAAMVVFIAAIMTCLNQTRQFFGKTDRGAEPMQRSEVEEIKTKIEQRFDSHEVLDREIADRLGSKLDRAEEYARTNIHELRAMLQSTNNTVALVQMKVTEVLQEGLRQMAERLDKTERALSQLGNRVSGLVGEMHGLKEELGKYRIEGEEGSH